MLAAAADMAAKLKGHMAHHLPQEKLRALKDLHAIFAEAASATAADPQADCCVDAPLAEAAAGPKEKVCFSPDQRPALSPAPPPRVARPAATALVPPQVLPRYGVRGSL